MDRNLALSLLMGRGEKFREERKGFQVGQGTDVRK